MQQEYRQAPPFDSRHYTFTGVPRYEGGAYDAVKPGDSTSTQTERPDVGMYALWSFCHFGGQKDLPGQAAATVEQALVWAAARSQRLLKDSPADKFAAELARSVSNPSGETPRGDGRAVVETNRLIGDLVGIARLARLAGRPAQAQQARELLGPLLRERLQFPVGMGTYIRGWEPVLWYDAAPELMRLLAKEEGPRIRAYMDATAGPDTKFNIRFSRNNFWHLAWAEGCMTDEMTITLPQVPRALYNLRVFVYADGPDELLRLADMPWCTGDLYYIEKLTYTLWAAAGSHWSPIP